MNHVNRDRRHDSEDGDLSKATDWPQHVVQVARQQLAKLDAHGWNETACKSGQATHVCKVLATSRWHHYLQTYFRELGRDHFEV